MLLRRSAWAITPVILLVALYLAFRSEIGGGLQAGVMAALAIVLHAVLFGASQTLAALPLSALRIAAAAGLAILIGGLMAQGAGGFAWRLVIELGLGLCAAASLAIGFLTFGGRAHELRGGEW
jgi:multicomponent Na+:H+ antiporter subunit B